MPAVILCYHRHCDQPLVDVSDVRSVPSPRLRDLLYSLQQHRRPMTARPEVQRHGADVRDARRSHVCQ